MGIYLNPGNDKFIKSVNSEIYVDKSGLIRFTNRMMNDDSRSRTGSIAGALRSIEEICCL